MFNAVPFARKQMHLLCLELYRASGYVARCNSISVFTAAGSPWNRGSFDKLRLNAASRVASSSTKRESQAKPLSSWNNSRRPSSKSQNRTWPYRIEEFPLPFSLAFSVPFRNFNFLSFIFAFPPNVARLVPFGWSIDPREIANRQRFLAELDACLRVCQALDKGKVRSDSLGEFRTLSTAPRGSNQSAKTLMNNVCNLNVVTTQGLNNFDNVYVDFTSIRSPIPFN